MSTKNDRRPAARPARRARRPHLEALEGRALLTIFVVNSTADVLNPGAGVVTLRSAIQQSNNNPDPNGNEIRLSVAGTYASTNGSGAFAILPPPSGGVTIKNTSGGAVTIDGSSVDRVFDIVPVANPPSGLPFVNIDGVIIQNGLTAGAGGGIRDQGSANLGLSNVVITNCTAGGNGGGVAMVNGGVPQLVVGNSKFFSNKAGAAGGGIYAPGTNTSTAVSNSLFQNNTAHDGGAIESPGPEILSLNSLMLDGNHAVGGNGGGLDVNNPAGGSTVLISSSLFTNNTAESGVNPPAAGTGNGGAINQVGGDLNINTSSQFVGNQATGAGGAISYAGNNLLILASTFKGNAAGASRGAVNPNLTAGDGGALSFSGTGIASQVTNSTFTLNTATGRGAAVVDAGSGTLALVNDTINANTSGGSGGGVALLGGASSGPLKVLNTIFYGNLQGATGSDVATLNGSSVTDLGGNLVGTVNQGNTGFGAGTLTANPLLGLLTDNGGQYAGVNPPTGGPTNQLVVQTEALGTGSPAIGKGVNSPLYAGVDERGFGRPGRTNPAAPSIGAFEPQVTTLASLDFVVENDNQLHTRSLDPSGSGNPGSGTGYPQVLVGPVKDIPNSVAVTRLGRTGSVEAFVIGTDDQVYAQTIDASNHTSGYFLAAPGMAKAIAAGTDASGNPILFIVSTDADANQLYYMNFDASGHATAAGYTKAAFGNFKLPTLTHDSAGNPLMFALSNDADKNQVYELKMFANGTPNGKLIKVNYGGVKELAVGHDASNIPEIFVVGLDDSINYLKFNANDDQLTGYVGFGGPLKSISFTSDASNKGELFGIGGDGQVYSHKFDVNGTPTGGFTKISATGVPGGAKSTFAGVDANKNPMLFVISATDSTVYSAPFNSTGDFVGPFTRADTESVTPVKRFVLA